MTRVQLFIDGTWLTCNAHRLAESSRRPGLAIDYGRLPSALLSSLERAAPTGAPYLLGGTTFVGSSPTNTAVVDADAAVQRAEFFERLRVEHGYTVHRFDVDYRGRRLRKADRDPTDGFAAREKCVDLCLATTMLEQAVSGDGYDVAIVVLGDRDFKPVLQALRRLGKRVLIASVQGSCASEFADARDPDRLRDFPLVWLDDLVPEVAYTPTRQRLTCASEFHCGDPRFETTYRPRPGETPFCNPCRVVYAQHVAASHPDSPVAGLLGTRQAGIVARLNPKGFGFIADADGREFWFHETHLTHGVSFADLTPGRTQLAFTVVRTPARGKAGEGLDVAPVAVVTDPGGVSRRGSKDARGAVAVAV